MKFTEEEIQKYQERIRNFVIPDPNDDLIPMYEMENIKNLLNLRAEKYDSPEHHEESTKLKKDYEAQKKKDPTLKKEFKVPRNKQNPNYTKLFGYLKKIRKLSEESYQNILKNYSDIVPKDLKEPNLENFKMIKALVIEKNLDVGPLGPLEQQKDVGPLGPLEQQKENQIKLLKEFLDFINDLNLRINNRKPIILDQITTEMNWIPDIRVVNTLPMFICYLSNVYLFMTITF